MFALRIGGPEIRTALIAKLKQSDVVVPFKGYVRFEINPVSLTPILLALLGGEGG